MTLEFPVILLFLFVRFYLLVITCSCCICIKINIPYSEFNPIMLALCLLGAIIMQRNSWHNVCLPTFYNWWSFIHQPVKPSLFSVALCSQLQPGEPLCHLPLSLSPPYPASLPPAGHMQSTVWTVFGGSQQLCGRAWPCLYLYTCRNRVSVTYVLLQKCFTVEVWLNIHSLKASACGIVLSVAIVSLV